MRACNPGSVIFFACTRARQAQASGIQHKGGGNYHHFFMEVITSLGLAKTVYVYRILDTIPAKI